MRVDALTSVRFFAAVAIVVHHLRGVLWLPADAFSHVALSQQVSLFFVLSGYILHLNYRNTIHEVGSFRFLLLRAGRLWPAHLVGLSFALAIDYPATFQWVLAHLSSFQIAQIFLMLQSWNVNMNVAFGINAPSWSISVELFFYAVFPLLCFWARRWGLMMLVLAAALTIVYLCIAQAALNWGWGSPPAFAYWSPPARLLEFVAGIAVCEFVVRRNLATAPKQEIWGTAVEAAVLAIVVIAQLVSLPMAMAASRSIGAAWGEYIAAAGPFPAFTLLIVVLHRGQGFMSKALQARWLVRLGEWSFALYLLHQPLIRWFEQFVSRSGTPVPIQVLIFTASLIGLSAFVFYCVEKPGIRLAKYVLSINPRQRVAMNTGCGDGEDRSPTSQSAARHHAGIAVGART